MKIEPLLIAAALERLEARNVEIADTNVPNVDTLEAELEDAEAEVAAYVQHVSARTPGFADGLAARELVVEEKRQALASMPHGDSLILDVQDADVFETFFEFNNEGQRVILGDLIERAILAPGKSDVQERIAVTWR
jgi:hypothetical protein